MLTKEVHPNLITVKKSLYILILLLSLNIYGQKKVLDHSDFDIWNRIQNSSIDSKGEYIMYSIEKGEKDSHLKIKDLDNNLIFDHYLKGDAKPMWMVRGVPAIEKGINQGYELLDNN